MGNTGKTTSSGSVDPRRARAIERALVLWYRREKRDLPWRKSRDPYAIWVSEVMLQQTQVATVIPYFERWMRRFPTLASLAEADESAVLGVWQGLGYYSRARALLSGARVVVNRHRGRIPADVAELRELPGIGPYTAGAIASIAFGRRAAIVDGNVTRVVSRVFALDGDPTESVHKRAVGSIAEALVPARDPSDFNQALMELGATVCTPRDPRCPECPLGAICRARREDRVSELPRPKPRKRLTEVSMVAAVVERGGRVLLAQKPLDARRWAGLWVFPATEISARESAEHAVARAVRESAGIGIRHAHLVTVIRHGITRFRITLAAYRCTPVGSTRAAGLAWKRPDELDELALPSPHRRIVRALSAFAELRSG